jgi:hypothetical protein
VGVFVGFADVVEVDVGELLVGGSLCWWLLVKWSIEALEMQ